MGIVSLIAVAVRRPSPSALRNQISPKDEIHLDHSSEICRRQAISQYTLDVGAHDLEVNKDLEQFGKVDPR